MHSNLKLEKQEENDADINMQFINTEEAEFCVNIDGIQDGTELADLLQPDAEPLDPTLLKETQSDVSTEQGASDTDTHMPKAYHGIDIEPDNPDNIPELRKLMRGLMRKEEKDYWGDMYEPHLDNSLRKAQKALGESRESSVEVANGGRKKRKSERKEAATVRVHRRDIESDGGNRKGERVVRKQNFLNDLVTCDIAIYGAHQTQYHCNGQDMPLFDARAMCNGIRKERTRATLLNPATHWSAEKVADELGYKQVPLKKLRTISNKTGFVIYDCNGFPLVFSLPQYFSKEVTKWYTDHLEELGKHVKLKTCQADASGRGSAYSFLEGRLVGCINMAYAWVPLLKKKTALTPSADMIHGGHTASPTKNVFTFNSIQNFHAATRKIGTMINYAMYRCHPKSFFAYCKMSARIRQLVPAAAALATHEPALSTGKSVIVCRNTPVHYDNKEAPEGWSPLIVMGDCQTGMLALPRLGIKFEYLPGTLVMIRG
ncbi:hypothetical protein RSAG8_00903, partial [Rhizoctonia solani AG-8 WAC10335]